MFNKLRMRLVLTNCITAGLIVLAMAAIAYFMISNSIMSQSQQFLQLISVNMAVQVNTGDVNPNMIAKIMGGLYPYFVVQVNNGGESVQTNFKTGIADDELLAIVKKILAAQVEKKELINRTNSDTGKKKAAMMSGTTINVGNRSFRYSDIGGNNGTSYLIFLDMAQEKALLGKVLFSLIMCVLAGLVMVFAGGFFLAGRSIKPIRLSWQRQRDFVADASHELRSPLAAIRSIIDVVLAKPDAAIAERRQFLEGVSAEAVRMSRLVDDMLLMARADSDAVVFRNENVNIAKVTESAVKLMSPVAEKKQIGCTLEIQATPLVRGDDERLMQVMLILLDNAIKYNPEGGTVHVNVKYQPGRSVIDVMDTGIGISREHLPFIFDRFYRVDKARSMQAGGQGLGLSIAKWIVEKHRGAITVTSEPGKGSTFSVTLPEA